MTCKTNDVWNIIWLNINTCRVGALTDSSVSMWQSWVTCVCSCVNITYTQGLKNKATCLSRGTLFCRLFLFSFLFLKCVNTLTLFSSDNWVILFFLLQCKFKKNNCQIFHCNKTWSKSYTFFSNQYLLLTWFYYSVNH